MGIGAAILNKAKEIGEGIKSAFTGAGDGISTVINSAKGQIPPELQGEISKIETSVAGELAKLKIETELKFAELSAEAQKTLYDFSIQYEGSATQVPKWILVLRSIIRPLITLVTFSSFVAFVGMDIKLLLSGKEMFVLENLPQAYWWIVGLVFGFWFGGKAGENIVDKIKK